MLTCRCVHTCIVALLLLLSNEWFVFSIGCWSVGGGVGVETWGERERGRKRWGVERLWVYVTVCVCVLKRGIERKDAESYVMLIRSCCFTNLGLYWPPPPLPLPPPPSPPFPSSLDLFVNINWCFNMYRPLICLNLIHMYYNLYIWNMDSVH